MLGDLAAPDVSGATICTGNATTIEATAGSAGEVRWYVSATATSQCTPVLHSTPRCSRVQLLIMLLILKPAVKVHGYPSLLR
ncbi:MAG: hypothetical protein WDO15_23670 [Bacteroidota bacterium]